MAEADRQSVKLISLERESQRVSQENQWQREATLATAGWQRRFVADAVRAEEMVELYRQLGFEVLLEVVQIVESGDDCKDCTPLMQSEYRTIYTRKRVKDDNTNGNT